jgi:uncharacterized protein (UPF0332 family)
MKDTMKDLERTRLKQARESLDEAQALLMDGMDVGFVLTNLYYAYYYPILALMNEGQVPTTMQSITLGLFERQYIQTGIMKKEYYDAVHLVFDIKPKCSGEKTSVRAEKIKELTVLASDFIQTIETYLENRSTT